MNISIVSYSTFKNRMSIKYILYIKMNKIVKTKKKVLKRTRKNRNTKKRYNKYKKQKTILFGAGKKEQDEFIDSTFEKIKRMNIEELLIAMPQLCLEFKENIVEAEEYQFTFNIRSFLVTSILLPFILKYNIYTYENIPYHKLDKLRGLFHDHVYLGRVIKKNNLTSLTHYPEKALELLQSCEDDEDYCVMDPIYLITDYKKLVEYYCDSDDPNKIKRINDRADLLNVEDGRYLYCILPNETLCLFDGYHSAGACGQPVLCAGNILIHGNKIKEIDNSSGHYAPPPYMLNKALEVLKRKGLTTDSIQDRTRDYGEIKVFVF